MNYYITHSDKNYVKTAEVLFESLSANSNCKIIYYTVNFFYDDSKYKNVIPIFVNIQEPEFLSKEYLKKTKNEFFMMIKPFIMSKALEFGDNNYCYLDADCIALYDCDEIFSNVNDIKSFPIAWQNCHEYMMHGERGNPFEKSSEPDPELTIEANLLKFLKIDTKKRTSSYKQTNVVLFNSKCYDFIEEWSDICFNKEILLNKEFYVPFNDEPIYNCLLWKNNLNEKNGHISINIPVFDSTEDFSKFIDAYKNPSDQQKRHGNFALIPSKNNINKIKFFHGRLTLEDKKFELIKSQTLPRVSKLFDVIENKNNSIKLSIYKRGSVELSVYGIDQMNYEFIFRNIINLESPAKIYFMDYFVMDFYKKIAIKIKIDDAYEIQTICTNYDTPLKTFSEEKLSELRAACPFTFAEIFRKDFYSVPKIWHDTKTVLDIGSNTGFFTFKALSEGAQNVICIEPDSRLNKHNQILNQKEKVKIINKAFYKKSDDKVTFHFAKRLNDAGGQTLFENFKNENSFLQECETISLKDILINKNEIDLIKCDCEGGEQYLLEDEALSCMQKKVKKIVLEVHETRQIPISKYLKSFEKYGFRCFYSYKNKCNENVNLYCLYGYNENFYPLNKILYVVPHFSTGGMPEYVLNKVKDDLNNNLDVSVLELNYYSDKYVVQRNELKNLIGDKFISAFSNKKKIKQIINSINPDILHLQEEPDLIGVDSDVLDFIYKKDKSYIIRETSHTSTYDVSTKRYFPDEFVFCCNHHFETYKDFNIKKSIYQYPIKKKEKNKESYKILGVDPNKKHVVQVGLFTPNKNQKYTLELAKLLENENYQFHFVGNMAENFSDYWGKLDFPSNCKIWGERDDVDNFYSIADLFILPSFAELNPISLKEALSYGLECLISDLTTIKNNNLLTANINILTNNKESDSALITNILNKKIKYHIIFDSNSLGDQIAWIPCVEEFRKQSESEVYCSCGLKSIFEKSYPNIKYVDHDFKKYSHEYKTVQIGYYTKNQENDPRLQSLQKIACDILNIDGSKEYKCEVVEKEKFIQEKPYVCIAAQSTAQAKYWNNKNGWDSVIKYLNEKGYDVYCIDKFKTFGVEGNFNEMPKGAKDWTGDFDLKERIKQINGAKFFIGLSSGLSWLSWALGKPTVLISGFTKEYNEFQTDYRVINKKVCHGCWNTKNHIFEKSNWFWCPENKKFECSESITPEMVINEINKII